MLKHKQIRASYSQYSAPISLIKKRGGSYRFIVNYRKLNIITIQDNYPLPNIEQAIQMVDGHQYYTKLDLHSGYFQIPIREEDKHKTAFITVHGLYAFNVLAQGHTISIQGVKPLPERINKILNIPQPTSLNQANAFISAIGWYRKFIKLCTKIAAPLLAVTNLTQQNTNKFRWDTPQQEAFNQLKVAIASEPLFLNYPDPNEPLILSTDASDYCIGCILY
ncbi:unnamed protein product [Rotaria sp. Silwood2]|nr:unnamed protein product [Rotaria sp. Silwood2]